MRSVDDAPATESASGPAAVGDWQPATGPGSRRARRSHGRCREVRALVSTRSARARALHAAWARHGRLVAARRRSIGSVLKLGGGGLWRDGNPAAARSVSAGGARPAPEVQRHADPGRRLRHVGAMGENANGASLARRRRGDPSPMRAARANPLSARCSSVWRRDRRAGRPAARRGRRAMPPRRRTGPMPRPRGGSARGRRVVTRDSAARTSSVADRNTVERAARPIPTRGIRSSVCSRRPRAEAGVRRPIEPRPPSALASTQPDVVAGRRDDADRETVRAAARSRFVRASGAAAVARWFRRGAAPSASRSVELRADRHDSEPHPLAGMAARPQAASSVRDVRLSDAQPYPPSCLRPRTSRFPTPPFAPARRHQDDVNRADASDRGSCRIRPPVQMGQLAPAQLRYVRERAHARRDDLGLGRRDHRARSSRSHLALARGVKLALPCSEVPNARMIGRYSRPELAALWDDAFASSCGSTSSSRPARRWSSAAPCPPAPPTRSRGKPRGKLDPRAHPRDRADARATTSSRS